MPVLIAMKFDGGLKRYAAGIKSELDGLKNFSKLWKMVIEYFEGRSDVTGFVNISPFVDIWNSEGHIIGGNWTNTAKYETWKAKNYKRFRKFPMRSEEHTSELQSHSFISYAVFCLKKKKQNTKKKKKNKQNTDI